MRDKTGSGALAENPLLRRLLVLVEDLGLNRDDFVIFGSAPLLAHGLRPRIRDLDVVARGETWQRALERGVPIRGYLNDAPMASFWGGRIEFSRGWISDSWHADTIIDNAETIEGLPYARLTDVLTYKQTLRRHKDIRDIDAIIAFLRRQGNDVAPALRPRTTGLTRCAQSGNSSYRA
jgi:hypothetical protein